MDWYRRSQCLFRIAGLLGIWATAACVTVQAQGTKAPAAKAGGKIALDKSGLSLAPADAAFFSMQLNMRKSLATELESGWIAEVRHVPYVQQMEQFLLEQWNNPQPQTQQVKSFLSSPIVRDVVLLLQDMTAREFFVFGDESWTGFFETFATLQYDLAKLGGEDPDAIREYFMNLEKGDVDEMPIPTTVFGFQLTDDANARNQLDALEGVLQLALGSAEQLKPIAKGLRRKDLSNGQLLTMTLQADDIPWDELPIPNADAQEIADHLAELLAGRKIVISAGVISNRLFLAISESADTLTKLGQGDTLLSADAFKLLGRNQPDDLRSVHYASGDFRDASFQTNFGNYFQRLAMQISASINESTAEPDKFADWQEKLFDDCEWLDDKIAEIVPEFAPALTYSFHSAEGLETMGYDWTPSALLENAKPLAVTRHGGTAPLLLGASRQRFIPQVGEIIENLLDEVPKHVDQILETGIVEEEEAEKVRTVMQKTLPIFEDMYAGLRDKLIPGMDGNESLLSITAQTTANQLSEDAPPPPEPLPLPEMGVVVKIKNKELFLAGCGQIIQGINQLIDVARQTNPRGLPPDVKVPEPKTETMAGGGERYSFPMGAPVPWYQFEIQMAINNEVAVLGYSTRQVRDLYQSRPLAARPAWFSDDKPVAAVGFVDISGIFRAARPWVHYSLAMAQDDLQRPLGPPQGEVPIPTGADVLQIWDSFKKLGKVAGTTVIDKDDVTVSHWIWVGE